MELEIREIKKEDYYNSYMELMFEFTNYKHNLEYNDFCKYIDKIQSNNTNKIIIVYSKIENKIIGSGTIFIIEKLHNNPIGQIEDVIITENYRKKGLGKVIIDRLIDIAINEMNCYKVILNCLDKNIGFYEKCGFKIAGVEMKKV